MNVVQNSRKYGVRFKMCYPHKYPYPHSGNSTRAYPYPGYFSIGVQSGQKFRGRVWIFLHWSTERTQVPGTGMEVVHATHTSVGYGYCPVMTWVIPVQYPHISTRAYPYPGYFSIGVQSEQKFRGRVWKSYMQNAHKCRVRVIPGNYPGNTRTVPDSSGRKKQN